MVAYPSDLRKPSAIEDVIQKPAASVVSLGGYAMTRGLGTALNKSWKLMYFNISEIEKSALDTFFNTYANQTFTWVHPDEGVTYNIFFSANSISYKRIYIDRYNYEVTYTQDNAA